jgi:hypothetical protein
LAQLEADGAHVPEFDEKPQLYEDLQFDYAAFFELSGSRQIGMQSGPIPISEMKAYCDLFGIDGFAERKLFLRRMQILDRVYLEWVDQKMASQRKK